MKTIALKLVWIYRPFINIFYSAFFIGADDSSSNIVIIITAIAVLAVLTLSAVVLIFYIR